MQNPRAWVNLFSVAGRNANTKPNTKMKIIEIHTNENGTVYFSTEENGVKIYSFTEDFNDIWTQDDQDAIDSDSTPSKI